MGRRTRPIEPEPGVDAILADPRIGWLPIRHHSPGCALHVERWIREHRPVAVLVEGPEDAAHLVQWLVHPEAAAPLVVLLAHTDTSGEEPVRMRTTWPLLPYDPEWVAIRAGVEVGAEVSLIDTASRAVPSGGSSETAMADSTWFRVLAERTGRPSFESFWEAVFDQAAASTSTERFHRAVLQFAWCARELGGAVPEAMVTREAHLRWNIDQALARHPEGRIAVVTGAWHAVALPWLKGKRLRPRPDKTAGTLLAASSYRALARRGVRYPGWNTAVHAGLDAGSSAALPTIVAITDAVRRSGVAVGTADAVGAVEVARGLARLRGNGAVTAEDVLDGVRSALVKGAMGTGGHAVLALAREVLIGRASGALPPEAGRPPLVEDFHAELRAHRLPLDGTVHEVRCDIHKQERHRAKSAFLHRCALLKIPMFGELPDGGGDLPHFRGPDLVEGTDLHLSTERWGLEADEDLDDHLLEISDLGTTIAEAAGAVLALERAEAGMDVAACAVIVLRAAQTHLTDVLPDLLDDLETALSRDPSFLHVVRAVEDLGMLGSYRSSLPTHGHRRVAELTTAAYVQACLRLPGVRYVGDDEAQAVVDGLETLVRFAVTGEGPPDRQVLVEHLVATTDDAGTQPLVRGAGFGLLAGLGAVRIPRIAAELSAYLRGPVEAVRRGGVFLEGVLGASRSTFLQGPRLLAAVHDVLLRLPDEEFLAVLPDLRRAFAVFVPSEIERIGEQILDLLTLREGTDAEAPIPPELAPIARDLDRRILEQLDLLT